VIRRVPLRPVELLQPHHLLHRPPAHLHERLRQDLLPLPSPPAQVQVPQPRHRIDGPVRPRPELAPPHPFDLRRTVLVLPPVRVLRHPYPVRDLTHLGIAIATPEEFLRVFDGAEPIPVPAEPFTRESFLRAIEANPYIDFPLDATPPEWMAAAWEIGCVREERSYDMARDVSKLGMLTCTPEWLHYLSRALPITRQVELYVRIRDDGNQFRDVEFRPQFERAFPACVPFLPPPVTDLELADLAHALGLCLEELRGPAEPPPSSQPITEDAESDRPNKDTPEL
jgi:hypothetical protein